MSYEQDKEVEGARYEGRARGLITQLEDIEPANFGSLLLPETLREPYILYEKLISENISTADLVLEIAAGTGNNSWAVICTGASLTASDISPTSLEVLEKRVSMAGGKVTTRVADMENLPFPDHSFDSVVCSGGLSYADGKLLMHQIWRVLKPNGVFICVDSLNENPVYKLNRWLHFIRGERTISTLKRMPSIKLLDEYGKKFDRTEITYLGALSFFTPLLSLLTGESHASCISNYVDSKINVKKLAFKFVMLARKQ
jgi:SAM-dependent methyltransferase